MKSNINILVFIIFLLSVSLSLSKSVGREKILFDYGWKFLQADTKGAEQTNFNDTRWRTLNLPHDWSIEGEFKEDAKTKGAGGYLPTGIGWYRKHFNLSADHTGQNIWIEFDGVYMNSDVWINGAAFRQTSLWLYKFLLRSEPICRKRQKLNSSTS